MTPSTRRWFEHLATSYAHQVKVCLFNASDIVHDLLYNRTLQERFFPDAILDALRIRQELSKTGELTKGELARITTENIDEYIQRLQAEDPRFTYEVRHTRDRKPTRTEPALSPGLVLSVSNAENILDVYVRDPHALQLDPPKLKFTAVGSGAEKFKEFLRTGRTQHISSEELHQLSSDFDFLSPTGNLEGATLTVSLRSKPGAVLSFRATFGKGSSAVVYGLIQFAVRRGGTDEVELVSTDTVPFEMSLVAQSSGTGSVNFKPRFEAANVRDVKKFVDALHSMGDAGAGELYDLQHGKVFLRFHVSGLQPTWLSHCRPFIEACAAVSDFYRIDLAFRTKPTAEDLTSLELLTQLIMGTVIPVDEFTAQIAKTSEPEEPTIKRLNEESSYRFVIPELLGRPVLFGQPVSTGPVELILTRCSVTNALEFATFLRDAPMGECATLRLKPPGEARARALGPEVASGENSPVGVRPGNSLDELVRDEKRSLNGGPVKTKKEEG